jgi:hypothetical protein
MFKTLRSLTKAGFNVRSARRDVETDASRLEAIYAPIERALRNATAEREGLSRRIEDVLARAAVTQGNDTDEYLMRDSLDGQRQNVFNNQIAEGQRRLAKLSKDIDGFQQLKRVFENEFPHYGIGFGSNS